MKKKLIKIIEILLIFCIIFSVYKMTIYYKSNKDFKKDNQEFEKIINTSSQNKIDNKKIVHTDLSKKDESLNSQIIVQKLKSNYPNIIGRIIIEGTDIDFPIVQSSDNSFYLNHNYKNEYHPFGAVFMDYRNSNDFTDTNTVIYGHNVRSGHVFHDLEKFKDESFVQNHPYITIDDVNNRKKYEIVAVYTASAYEDYRKPEYVEDELRDFLMRIDDKNILHKTMPKTNHSILTLSTCYGDKDRLVLHAIRIN